MSIQMNPILAAATKHGDGLEWSEIHFQLRDGKVIRKGLRAWGNYSHDTKREKRAVAWPPAQEC
ncbi:hypothetical protein ACHMW5_13545 [Azospirillum melinis]|uniref:hypothetical protein n=1 Tax=Azospirillum melinis TaxID=328839 RepID=UPI0037581CB6